MLDVILSLAVDDFTTMMEPRAVTRERLVDRIAAETAQHTHDLDRMRAEWGRSPEQVAMVESMPDRIG